LELEEAVPLLGVALSLEDLESEFEPSEDEFEPASEELESEPSFDGFEPFLP